MSTELDSFETRLLAELRDYITEQRDDDNTTPDGQGRLPRRWLAVAASSIVVVAAALLLPGVGTSPAYSVGEGNAGEIRVDINRPEDAAGLQEALESTASRPTSPTSPHCSKARPAATRP